MIRRRARTPDASSRVRLVWTRERRLRSREELEAEAEEAALAGDEGADAAAGHEPLDIMSDLDPEAVRRHDAALAALRARRYWNPDLAEVLASPTMRGIVAAATIALVLKLLSTAGLIPAALVLPLVPVLVGVSAAVEWALTRRG